VVLALVLPARPAWADEDALVTMRLDNGLRVVLAQDHRTPFVAVGVRYSAGSRDEREDQHGIAHLAEHLAFRSTRHVPDGGFFRHLESAGAIRINGATFIDSTYFFEFVPANALERVLWLESERMGYLAEAITPAALQAEREIVNHERAQKHQYGLAATFMSSLYPEGHPYHSVRSESGDDLRRLKVDDLRAFVRRYYVPSNAVLVIAGDILPSRVAPMVKRYFATLPGGPTVSRSATISLPPIPYSRSTRLEVTGGVPFPTVVMAWRSPPLYAAGDAELDVLAMVLCGHLRSETMKTPGVVRRVGCAQQSFELGSVFTIQAVLGPAGSADEVTGIVDHALDILSRVPLPEQVVTLANVGLRSRRLFAIESLDTRASAMADYVLKARTPDFFGQDLARYDRIDPELMRSVAQGTLRFQGRTVLVARPSGIERDLLDLDE
jgi:zinc protease